MDQAKVLASAGSYQSQQQQHTQQYTQQQQPQQRQQAPASFLSPSSVEGYDMSSLDQLQQHALQLSASAGLTNLFMPNQTQQSSNGILQQQQQQHHQQQQQQQNPQQQQQLLFLQQNNQQGIQQSQNGSDTQQSQNNDNSQIQQQQQQQLDFLRQNGIDPSQLPVHLQQMFASASGNFGNSDGYNMTPAAPQQQQSYSNSGIPIPMQMLVSSQQQQSSQQQPQAQPMQVPNLQPIQPASAGAFVGGSIEEGSHLAGSKRAHEPSVVSSDPISSASKVSVPSGTTSSQIMDNFQDYPEFQLRNKDGSVITEEDLEKMTPSERRRYERNLREQQRSFRISQQIQQLRDVLTESNVPFKPNKYSILVSVADYIKQLQTRAVMLDSEHKKLFKTIQETNEMVQSGTVPDTNASSEDGSSNAGKVDFLGMQSNSGMNQGDMFFVKGLDYKSVFDQAPTASGVASIDGRILACNAEMESMLECPREEIERQSLFTLVQNHQEIFEAMAELLKRADALSTGSLKADPVQLLYWSGQITTPDEKQLGMNITLACSKDGNPKFFSFCIAPETQA